MDVMKKDPRKAFELELAALGAREPRILALSCDSASGGGLGEFFRTFPRRSIELGIAEQNGVCVAASLARQGFIPVLVIINPFLTMRAYEQIRDDIGYANQNVKLVGSGGGLAYSTLGSTHIALEDVALMRTIPNLTIFAPGDAAEVAFALEQAVCIEGPVYIRMPRQARPLNAPPEGRRLIAGRAERLTAQGGIPVFTYGPSTGEALRAAAILKKEGLHVTVINMTTLAPLDRAAVVEHCRGQRMVFTVEEHIPAGGLGSAVAEVLSTEGVPARLTVLAVPVGAKQTGPYEELLRYYHISGEEIAKTIRETTGKGEVTICRR